MAGLGGEIGEGWRHVNEGLHQGKHVITQVVAYSNMVEHTCMGSCYQLLYGCSGRYLSYDHEMD